MGVLLVDAKRKPDGAPARARTPSSGHVPGGAARTAAAKPMYRYVAIAIKPARGNGILAGLIILPVV
ncbi:hypothetical protein GCM10025771_03460 [Niveibacterium umoris]